MENNGENSSPLTSLSIHHLVTDCNADRSCKKSQNLASENFLIIAQWGGQIQATFKNIFPNAFQVMHGHF